MEYDTGRPDLSEGEPNTHADTSKDSGIARRPTARSRFLAAQLVTRCWQWLKARQPFKLAQTVAETLTQHPQLSWGGGAGVIFLFGVATEVSASAPNLKVKAVSAFCYLLTLFILVYVLVQKQHFKAHKTQAAAVLTLFALLALTLWYVLLPALPPPSKPPPSAKEIADELEKRGIAKVPSATPSPIFTATPPPSLTATPVVQPSLGKRSKSSQPKKKPCSWKGRLLGEC